MPVPAVTDDPRNPRLSTALFRAGVACAPVAALLVLVADSNGPLRVAAVLALLAVVLIGLSIALRPDGGARVGELRGEIERLRHELHGEIVAAAQRGNQALDQTQRTQEAVVALGRRLDAGAAAPAATGGAQRVPVPVDAPAGRAAVPDADRWDEHERDRNRVGESQSPGHLPGGHSPAGAAGAYAAFRPSTGEHGADDRFAGQPGTERPARTYGATAGPAGTYGATAGGVWSPEPEGRHAAPLRGVVRHTETVHVTRHTVVDGARNPAGARDYDRGWPSGPDAPSWAEDRERRSWPAAQDEVRRAGADGSADRSWSERGGRARDARGQGEPPEVARAGAQWDAQGWADQSDGRGWDDGRSDRGGVDQHGGELVAGGDAEGEYWSQLRAGNRWAAVREDERGRELRLGEQRAQVRTDRGGAEYRVDQRWAAVRRDEPGRDRADAGHGGWSEPVERSALPPPSAEWGPPRQRQAEPQRQPEPRWRPGPQGQPEPGQYGRGDNRWR
ncbi:hypothetical protein [Salinispora sp. H7-4]|uniref:hypothetical protein n=1 Tax=Salinispora sp. H7-4 TaxID=2748321 RepID=UPI0015D34EF7|nr:hypothetical protein [Salinispora sp. H7-4]NYT95969.1 hypothetical protein [Salinispora sp. H7-4]